MPSEEPDLIRKKGFSIWEDRKFREAKEPQECTLMKLKGGIFPKDVV